MEKKRCLVYARQSSGSDDFSDSVENQVRNCKALAKKEGLEIVGVFQDLNTSGKTYPVGAESTAETDRAFARWFANQTGSKKFREGLGAVIARLAEVDFVIVDEMTRLYRPVTRSYLEGYINQAFAENGVQVLQVKGGSVDLSKFDQSLIQTLKNAINDEQIANQKAKAAQQFAKLKNSGVYANGGGKAFGTCKAGKGIVFDDSKTPIISYVFAQVLAYTPYAQIIRHVNDNYRGQLNGKCMYTSTFRNIISNPIYAGYMRNSEGELIRNTQVEKGIVSFEVWQKAQEILNDKKKAPSRAQVRFLPFRGLLYCGNCGSSLVSGTDKTGTFYYCREGAQTLHNPACSGSRLVHSTQKEMWVGLKEAVSPLLAMALIDAIEKEERRKANAENLDSLKAKLANLEEKVGKVTELFINGLYTQAQLEKALASTKAQIQELQRQIAGAENPCKGSDAKEHLRALGLTFKAYAMQKGEIDDGEFVGLLHQVIKRIDSFPEFIRISTIYGTFDLPRFIYKNRRNFPIPTLKIYGKHPEDFRFVVEYETGKSAVLLETPKMTIKTI